MKAKRRRIKNAWCASEPEKEQRCRMKLQEMETEGRGDVQTGARSRPTTCTRVSSEDRNVGPLQPSHLIK